MTAFSTSVWFNLDLETPNELELARRGLSVVRSTLRCIMHHWRFWGGFTAGPGSFGPGTIVCFCLFPARLAVSILSEYILPHAFPSRSFPTISCTCNSGFLSFLLIPPSALRKPFLDFPFLLCSTYAFRVYLIQYGLVLLFSWYI